MTKPTRCVQILTVSLCHWKRDTRMERHVEYPRRYPVKMCLFQMFSGDTSSIVPMCGSLLRNITPFLSESAFSAYCPRSDPSCADSALVDEYRFFWLSPSTRPLIYSLIEVGINLLMFSPVSSSSGLIIFFQLCWPNVQE